MWFTLLLWMAAATAAVTGSVVVGAVGFMTRDAWEARQVAGVADPRLRLALTALHCYAHGIVVLLGYVSTGTKLGIRIGVSQLAVTHSKARAVAPATAPAAAPVRTAPCASPAPDSTPSPFEASPAPVPPAEDVCQVTSRRRRTLPEPSGA
jgi:hypothetical protein